MDPKMERLVDRHVKTESEGYSVKLSFTIDGRTHCVHVDSTPAATLPERSRSAGAFLAQRLADELCDCGLTERMMAAGAKAGVHSHTDQCRLVRELEAQ